jgi:hypothetical protein
LRNVGIRYSLGRCSNVSLARPSARTCLLDVIAIPFGQIGDLVVCICRSRYFSGTAQSLGMSDQSTSRDFERTARRSSLKSRYLVAQVNSVRKF